MNMNLNIKNTTRIASTLGTWTGQTHLKTDIGKYELLAYFVIHFMPDPMRGYGCSMDGCIEHENHVCETIGNDVDVDTDADVDADGVRVGVQPKCNDIAGNVVDWSDVSAFMYFGARIDAGFPFNKHRAQDTGGWVGPFNIIMAKGDISQNNNDNNDHDDDDNTTPKVVDRYVSRYVKSPLTKYLQMPTNCTLLGEDDFNKVAGPIGVNSTTYGQYDPDRDYYDDNYDPYHEYLDTCDNGDVQPVLPLFEFDFEQSTMKDANGTAIVHEAIQVKVNYKFLTMPNKDDFMYNLWPMVKRKFNKADMGFQVSGPYCYGGDPKRGYSFDMNFDTRDPKAMLKLNHGCVEGLPCTPPAAELYNLQRTSSGGGSGGGNGTAPDSGGGNTPIIPDDGAATIDVGQTFFFMVVIMLLLPMLIFSCCLNCRYHRRLKRVSTAAHRDDPEIVVNDTPYERMVDDDDAPSDAGLNYGGNGEEEKEEEEAAVDTTVTTPLIERAEEERPEIV